MKRTLLIISLALTGLITQAQEKWSLEQCISYALDNNIQVKQSLTDIEVSRLQNQQAKMAYIPSLNASASQSTNWGRSLDPTTYSFVENKTTNNVNGGFSLSTTVFAGMQKLHTLKKSELSLSLTEQSTKQIQNEITIAVSSAFLQVVYEKERIANTQAQIASVEEEVTRTQKLVDAGSQPYGALLELQSQLAGEKYNLVAAQNSYDVALLTLRQLLELNKQPGFDIYTPQIDSLPKSMVQNLEYVYTQAQTLPQIEVAKLQSQIARRDLSIAKARMYPTLNMGVNYGSSWSDARQKPEMGPDGTPIYGKYPFFEQLADNASTSLQFSLSVPIFNSLNAQRGIRIAKLNLQKTELGVDLAQNRLLKEIQQAYTDAKGALEKYYSANAALMSTQKSFDYASQKFSAGATTSVDYTTAKNKLIVAQSAVTQAKYEYLLRSKILDFYAGIPITL